MEKEKFLDCLGSLAEAFGQIIDTINELRESYAPKEEAVAEDRTANYPVLGELFESFNSEERARAKRGRPSNKELADRYFSETSNNGRYTLEDEKILRIFYTNNYPIDEVLAHFPNRSREGILHKYRGLGIPYIRRGE